MALDGVRAFRFFTSVFLLTMPGTSSCVKNWPPGTANDLDNEVTSISERQHPDISSRPVSRRQTAEEWQDRFHENCESLAGLAASCGHSMLSHHNTPHVQHSAKHATEEEWLDMELFLRMTSSHAPMFDDTLLPSLLIFWPKAQLRLVVVLDAENEDDVAWKPKLEAQLAATGMASYKVFLEEPSDVYEGGRKPGHNRMQWGMFYPEKYVSAEYVGFIDTDTLFTTVVHPAALYKNGRPKVFGMVGLYPDAGAYDMWMRMGNTTAFLLQRPEVIRAMSYFPVIIKVSHVVELRSYITTQMGEPTFDLAFKAFTTGYDTVGDHFSQFNIMANYNFYHRHCEYWFALQEMKPGLRDPVEGQTACLDYILNEINTMPQVRVSVHWAYHYGNAPEQKDLIMREGYCRSGGTVGVDCNVWASSSHAFTLQDTLFEFEGVKWTWNPLCRRAQMIHYAKVASSQHKWPDNFDDLLSVLGTGTPFK